MTTAEIQKKLVEEYGYVIKDFKYTVMDLDMEVFLLLRKYLFNLRTAGAILFFMVWLSCIYFFILN